jgi:hypothetical protein
MPSAEEGLDPIELAMAIEKLYPTSIQARANAFERRSREATIAAAALMTTISRL